MTLVLAAAPAVQPIGYLEAWRLWFAGQQVPGDALLWFMSLRWWARAGKIATFLGGTTVVLDIIGPERLRKVAERRNEIELGLSLYTVFPVVGGILLTLFVFLRELILPVVVVGVALLARFAVWLARAKLVMFIVHTLDNSRPAQLYRWIAVGMFLVGFHFDLLSS